MCAPELGRVEKTPPGSRWRRRGGASAAPGAATDTSALCDEKAAAVPSGRVAATDRPRLQPPFGAPELRGRIRERVSLLPVVAGRRDEQRVVVAAYAIARESAGLTSSVPPRLMLTTRTPWSTAHTIDRATASLKKRPVVETRIGTIWVAPAMPRPPMPLPATIAMTPATIVPWPTLSVTPVAPARRSCRRVEMRPARSGSSVSTPVSMIPTGKLDPPPTAAIAGPAFDGVVRPGVRDAGARIDVDLGVRRGAQPARGCDGRDTRVRTQARDQCGRSSRPHEHDVEWRDLRAPARRAGRCAARISEAVSTVRSSAISMRTGAPARRSRHEHDACDDEHDRHEHAGGPDHLVTP